MRAVPVGLDLLHGPCPSERGHYSRIVCVVRLTLWTYLVKSAMVRVKVSVTSDDLDWTKTNTYGGH